MQFLGFTPEMETIKDGLKLIILFLPLLYFFFKAKSIIIKDKRLTLLIGGFLILFMALFLDFAGDLAALDDVFIIGANFRYHELLETLLGSIGFILFTAGIALEINYIKKENIEKQKTIQKLKEQTEKLRKFDELKSKFIQDVSHEFQSPLTNASLSLNNIIEGLIGEVPEGQKQALEAGKRNIERLSRLAREVLTLSQIESGQMTFHGKLHSITSLAHEAYLSLKSLVENKHLTFKSTIILTDPILWCDGDKIMQVFINLMSNAIKYSPEQSHIAMTITEENHVVKVQIEDQGQGISKDDLAKLFNRFERLKEQKTEGTGLGLVISKEIISLHHGKIWAESTPGQNTRFIFTLPKTAAGQETGLVV